MLTLRLKLNKAKHPRKRYWVVAQEKHKAVKKKIHEKLGTYNPYSKELILNKERVLHYVNLNVEISKTLLNLFKKNGILEVNNKK